MVLCNDGVSCILLLVGKWDAQSRAGGHNTCCQLKEGNGLSLCGTIDNRQF